MADRAGEEVSDNLKGEKQPKDLFVFLFDRRQGDQACVKLPIADAVDSFHRFEVQIREVSSYYRPHNWLWKRP